MNKILLVEDRNAITMGLEFLLKEEGYLFEQRKILGSRGKDGPGAV